ncbi:hypothetical protein BY996DRAFT_6412016 [Phakopsora pachyrhizi]|nr:hypothetical protein BY996DRAFT_6412016 [Phakopsora pachyrhizi]
MAQHTITRDQGWSIPIQPYCYSSTPDLLEMNLRYHSHLKNACLHPRALLCQASYQTPPLKKTWVTPKTNSLIQFTCHHPLGNGPTIAPILLPASLTQKYSVRLVAAPYHAQQNNKPSGANFIREVLHRTEEGGYSNKQAIVAIGICFLMTEIFKAETLADFMQNIVRN